MPNSESGLWKDKEEISEWHEEWENFLNVKLPAHEEEIDDESERAFKQLSEAVTTVLSSGISGDIQDNFSNFRDNRLPDLRNRVDWPVLELQELFDPLTSTRIEAKITRLNQKLEALSFDEAKRQWLERCSNNPEGLRALSELKAALPRTKLKITEEHHSLFEKVLDILPIWVVTGQAAQSVPLVPGGFDLILIDEASQCTLTNLLPLLYRGKSIGVIGDTNQLPAIPSIPQNMEQALVERYGIQDYAIQFGHASNDVYKMGVASLPNREGDVLNLDEHYRSHPLIIGFSNRYIYQKTLKLRREPFTSEMSSYPPGIYVEEISDGEPQPQKTSWVNEQEAQHVIDLIRRLQEETRGRSIGVVTPFRVQRERLEELCNQSAFNNVEVNTVHGFQGGEKDIIIFSPVVGPGVPPGTLAWVGNPNQVNVTITRAREVFILAGQANWIERNAKGLLGDLARYCIDVNELQLTSRAEAHLYSYLLLEGIFPEIHPIIADMEVDFRIDDLIIEVDGQQHASNSSQDDARDAALSGLGYRVLRFSARAVLETVAVVINEIKRNLEGSN